MPTSRPPYPLDFRHPIIARVRAGRTPAEVAEAFEPTAHTLSHSIAQADPDDGQPHDGLTSAEREAWRKLRRKNRQRREARERVAKAAACFAQQTHSVPKTPSSSSRPIRPSIASPSGVVCGVSPAVLPTHGAIVSHPLVRERRQNGVSTCGLILRPHEVPMDRLAFMPSWLMRAFGWGASGWLA